MLKTRVIPSLLLHNGGLYKTVKFRNPVYIGDPINAIKIFNDKEVDELVIIDIDATIRGSIDYNLISRINKEAFMPLGYGGGIKTTAEVKRILQLGYEKVIINSAALDNIHFLTECAESCGAQSVVCCVDNRKNLFGNNKVFDYRKKKTTKISTVDWIRRCQVAGAGEILLYSVDRDGSYLGYDTDLVKEVSEVSEVPLVALGGASKIEDLKNVVVNGKADAVAAGSIFVFHGTHKAVLISYPDKKQLKELF